MIRKVLGFALLGLLAWLVLQLVLGILGTVVGLAVPILVLGLIAGACYVGLRVLSPSGAAKLRDALRGHPTRPV